MQEFVKKLIERLEEWSFEAEIVIPGSDGYDDTANREIICTKNAIEIVNQLAEEYNNDFCEWFKYDYRTIAPKNHDAENPYWRIPENWDKLKFCPYCGKKIKVVE